MKKLASIYKKGLNRNYRVEPFATDDMKSGRFYDPVKSMMYNPVITKTEETLASPVR